MKHPTKLSAAIRTTLTWLPFLLLGLSGFVIVLLRNQWHVSGDPFWYQLSRLIYAICVGIIGLLLIVVSREYIRVFNGQYTKSIDHSKVIQLPETPGTIIIIVIGVLLLTHAVVEFTKWEVVPPLVR